MPHISCSPDSASFVAADLATMPVHPALLPCIASPCWDLEKLLANIVAPEQEKQ